MRETNLFEALSQEWEHASRSPAAATAWSRWSQGAPVLAELESVADAIAYCRHNGPDAPAVLAAIANHAGADNQAARAVLQAVLPGLAGVSRRAWRGGQQTWLWDSIAEVDQLVVATAYGLIRDLRGDALAWVARRVVDGTWQRLRSVMASRVRWAEHRSCLDATPITEEAATRSYALRAGTPGEDLAAVLSDALERDIVDPLDAWVVYASRVHELTLARLGAEVGTDRHELGQRRARAEQALVAAGGHL